MSYVVAFLDLATKDKYINYFCLLLKILLKIYPLQILIIVKYTVNVRFCPVDVSKPIRGSIIDIDSNDIIKPTTVFVIASIRDCFFVCIFTICMIRMVIRRFHLPQLLECYWTWFHSSIPDLCPHQYNLLAYYSPYLQRSAVVLRNAF